MKRSHSPEFNSDTLNSVFTGYHGDTLSAGLSCD